ncbi:Gfo/Idh/MocA family protein [Haloglomus halophilum]|uniref:Gfo/Idh/MocA family protein n=1 Tax=Haloglomus halophilum TaxID=2962672 RepID=UPI0020C9B670|nr:Gfo/Idh/MocA family oxidoreductase [Haloglomus halophilum]
MSSAAPVRAGVIGVGTMGQNHARVYRELPEAELRGVFDADTERATQVAETYGTEFRSMDDLLDGVDVVSVAVPTEYHYETVRECIDAGVHVLVEKPFVAEPENGHRLVEFAEDRGVTLQVGHIERFNPATRKLMDIVEDLDVIAVDARRLGPPVDRDIDDSAVMDLMIHDIDIVTALVDEEVVTLDAIGNDDVDYAAANLQFDSGVVGQLTASRVTQEKERQLSLSAENCRVKVDYIDQTIEIHRQSAPEYVEEDGDVTYHHENVVERVSVEKREPLKNELSAFVEAATTDAEPVVTAEDGLRALRLSRLIEDLADERTPVEQPVAVR